MEKKKENPITPSSTNTVVHFYLDDQNQRSTLVFTLPDVKPRHEVGLEPTIS